MYELIVLQPVLYRSTFIKQSINCCFIFLLVTSLSSCGFILGIKSVKDNSPSALQDKIQKYSMEDFINCRIDIEKYQSFYDTLKQTDSNLYRKLFQPLQLKVFDNSGIQMFHLVNCDVGGFPKLKWNREGTFDAYPPLPGRFRVVKSWLNFRDEITFYESIGDIDIKENFDLSIIVFWSDMFYRNSKHLIDLVKTYLVSFDDKNIQLIFVNVDDFYLDN